MCLKRKDGINLDHWQCSDSFSDVYHGFIHPLIHPFLRSCVRSFCQPLIFGCQVLLLMRLGLIGFAGSAKSGGGGLRSRDALGGHLCFFYR